MNANELLFYVRGVFEHTPKPSAAVWSALRNEVLRATPVKAEIIPVEVVNPIAKIAGASKSHHDCNCDKS